MEGTFNGIKFTDEDVINLGDWIPLGEYNPHNVRPWLLHDHGFVLCIVFATCEPDALDEAADHDKLDRYLVTDPDLSDYPDEEGLAFLGNAGIPFDIESLGIIELPNPPASFCAQWNVRPQATKTV